jgi:hypothetical protein
MKLDKVVACLNRNALQENKALERLARPALRMRRSRRAFGLTMLITFWWSVLL